MGVPKKARQKIMAIDIRVRRRLVILDSDRVTLASTCPECKGVLECEKQQYAVYYTAGPGDRQAVQMNAAIGFYCTKCPTVVMDAQTVRETLCMNPRMPDEFKYGVAGLVFRPNQDPPDGCSTLGSGAEMVYVFKFEQANQRESSAADRGRLSAAEAKRARRRERHAKNS